MSVTIAGRAVGDNQPPMIVAELSGNHGQSLSRALEMVEVAASNGAHAIKLQTYTPDTMTTPSTDDAFTIKSDESLWAGRNLYQLYEQAHTPWAWHEPIFKRAEEVGIAAFSSAFDITAVDFLESIGTPAYKISSFECCDIRLLEAVARTGKPVIISSGMAEFDEIETALNTLRSNGCEKIILLKCTSNYPATANESNLRTITDLRTKFRCEIGLSDHTIGTAVAIGAVALGAVLIEKHFTLDKLDGGVDSEFSIDPAELSSLVMETKTCWEALGGISYGPTKSERENCYYRRSLYAARDIQKGQLISNSDILSLRPALGLDSKYIKQVIDQKAAKPIRAYAPILSTDLKSD